MSLQFQRPLVALDLETTGTNVGRDRIVEFAAVKIRPNGERERLVIRINPERSIPPEATAVHGITDEDVAGAPTFADVAAQLYEFLNGCDLAGFGIVRFDVPLLTTEFRRVGVELDRARTRLVDAQIIYHLREPRNLTAALAFYCGRDLANAHSAEADALAAWDVLQGQLAKYPDLPHSVEDLDQFCNPRDPDAVDPDGKLRWSAGQVVLTFGQKAGMSLRELAETEPSYLRWILNKDFSPEVKKLAENALGGVFPSRRT